MTKYIFKGKITAKDNQTIDIETVFMDSSLEGAKEQFFKKFIQEILQSVDMKQALPNREEKYCSECNMDFASEGAYKRHRARVHGIDVQEAEDAGTINLKNFMAWAREIYDRSGAFDVEDISIKFNCDKLKANQFLNNNFGNRTNKSEELIQTTKEFWEMFEIQKNGLLNIYKSKNKHFAGTEKGFATP